MIQVRSRTIYAALSICLALSFCAAPALSAEPTRDEVIALMAPFAGRAATPINRDKVEGKILCGYQGWFTTGGDTAGRGWRHYQLKGKFEPGFCAIDLWPDVSELTPEERYPTPFLHANGQTAEVFSSHNRPTVLRHFQWMKEYGIDGVFLQRFGVETDEPLGLHHCNTVLSHCREGANRFGRCYALMYDLTALDGGGLERVAEDWKLLVDRMRLTRDKRDKAYLQHHGKPLVAVWGIGFNDKRKYTLDQCARLVDFLQNDPKYGGNSVMIGVPTGWRTLDQDSTGDKRLHDIVQAADIISPWTVGRYKTIEEASSHAARRWQPDFEWCREHNKLYLPVTFPGFSWNNLKPGAQLDEIPRLQGRFLWQQLVDLQRLGTSAVYLAMFDEMDEGTAIFKCTSDPPVGKSRFSKLEDMPSDHYLWLAGLGGKLIRGQIAATDVPPIRPQSAKTARSRKKPAKPATASATPAR
jgi:hypothetical protein